MNFLKIIPYGDDNFTKALGEAFVCKINPANYTHQHSARYNKSESAKGEAGQTPAFEYLETEKVSFDLHFDGTGVIPGTGDVADSIAKLKKAVYYYKGDIHRPAYLKLVWGKNFQRTESSPQDFRCQLSSMSISYTLFKPDGTPLRAKVSLSFEEFRTAKQILASAKPSSPDMTHIKVVRQGDTLPGLCKEVYNDPAYYLQVAEVNRLPTVLSLEPGTELVFPPLKSDLES